MWIFFLRVCKTILQSFLEPRIRLLSRRQMPFSAGSWGHSWPVTVSPDAGKWVDNSHGLRGGARHGGWEKTQLRCQRRMSLQASAQQGARPREPSFKTGRNQRRR